MPISSSSEAPAIRVRNSQLSTLRLCRYAYKRTYVDGDEGLPSPSLDRGSYTHEAIGEAVHRIVDGDATLDVHEIAFRHARGDRSIYSDVLHALITFQEQLGESIVIEPRRVFLLEERLEMPVELGDGSEAVFHGKPDMVGRLPGKLCEITDWKTNWWPDTEEEFEVYPQLDRYALLVHDHYPGFERFVLRKQFVRYRNASLEREITLSDLEQVRHELVTEIEQAIEVEEGGEYPATGGGWCGVCRHHAECPLILAHRDLDRDWVSVSDDTKASELAQVAIAMDAASRRIKDQVKSYLDEHPDGHVPVAGGTYGYGPVTHREITVDRLRQVFDAERLEMPDDVLRVDLKVLDRLCDQQLPGDVAERIRASVETRESSRCQFRRDKTARGKAAKSPKSVQPEEEEELL